MYVKRIILDNVGPIHRLDIPFPGVDEEKPKPVVFVGENGSGKSILLSYIVNGLLMAQDAIYENPEMEKGKVYKVRNPSYIKVNEKYTFGKVEFEQDLSYYEWLLSRSKKEFQNEFPEDAGKLASAYPREWAEARWNDGTATTLSSNLSEINREKMTEAINQNCILYFPPNRFEEPAWLNQENLNTQAKFVDIKKIGGITNRQIINYAPLRNNLNWLLGVVFDWMVFERTTIQLPIKGETGNAISRSITTKTSGEATNAYNMALAIAREIMRGKGNIQFGIGRRGNRAISLKQNNQVLIPNIFQLSTGETALFNLFLSILRDFDLSKTPLTKAEEIRGIVVVDEIDLHLHSVHQYEVLPALMKMFPRVQFVVTSHSPLFVLGLQKVLGEDGFTLYEMPDGKQISPEEFQEVVKEYRSFAETELHTKELRKAIEESQKPILLVEGETDIRYLKKAASFLGMESVLRKFQVKNGGGRGTLDKSQKFLDAKIGAMIPLQKIVLLYDSDTKKPDSQKGNVYTRCISLCDDHPIKKGIENLFSKELIERARKEKPAFIDIMDKHTESKRGEKRIVPEKWVVNDDEKTNLCDWFCEHCTADDFQHFKGIFGILEKILSDS